MSGIGHNQNFVSINSLTDAQRKELKEAIVQMNDSMTRVVAERDYQKETINNINDKTGVDKKIVRRMAKVYFRANYSQEQEENRQFEDFYDGVMK
jgi:chromatin segregation and condensation protein Rec8/ScpA/Scc1 (kleisin family)